MDPLNQVPLDVALNPEPDGLADFYAAQKAPPTGPDVLGMGAPPAPPPPIYMSPPQGNKWADAITVALAALAGPGRGTGMLQGLQMSKAQQMQTYQIAQRNAQQLAERNQQIYELQMGAYEQDARRRQQVLQQNVAKLQELVKGGVIKDDADMRRYAGAAAQMAQAQGLRVDPNYFLTAVPFHSPDARERLYTSLDKGLANAQKMKAPIRADSTIVYEDENGLQKRITVKDAVSLTNYPLLINPDGTVGDVPTDKPLGDPDRELIQARAAAIEENLASQGIVAGAARRAQALQEAVAESEARKAEARKAANAEAVTQAGLIEGARQKAAAPYRDRGSSGAGGDDSDVRSIADAIERGDDPPDLSRLYGKAAAVRAELDRRRVPIKRLQMEWAAAQATTRNLNSSQQVRFRQLGTSVVNTIDEVLAAANELKQGGVQLWNRAKRNTLQQVYGNTPYSGAAARYVAATAALKEEMANLVQGGYAPTEAAFALANEMLNRDYGIKDLEESLRESQRLINFRLNAAYDVRPIVPGQTPPPDQTQPPPKTTYYDVNGKVVR